MWNERARMSISVGTDGTVTATRYFKVFNASPEAIVSNPTAILRGGNLYGLPEGDSLPAIGSDLAGFTGITLQNYDVQPDGLSSLVEANYASGNVVIFPPPDPHGAWEGSFQTETFQIPFAVLKTSFVPGIPVPEAPPGSPVPRVAVQDWAFDEQPIFQTVVRHARRARLVVNLAMAVEIIAENNNKLHRIGSRWYRFEAGDYHKFDSTRYEFNYAFVYDSGTKSIRAGSPPATDPGGPSVVQRNYMLPPAEGFLHPLPTVYPNTRYARPPFCNIFAVRGITSPSGNEQGQAEPEFIPFCNYDVSANNGLGWLDLPGIVQ